MCFVLDLVFRCDLSYSFLFPLIYCIWTSNVIINMRTLKRGIKLSNSYSIYHIFLNLVLEWVDPALPVFVRQRKHRLVNIWCCLLLFAAAVLSTEVRVWCSSRSVIHPGGRMFTLCQTQRHRPSSSWLT